MKLDEIRHTYTQQQDDCAQLASDTQTLVVEVVDAGAGPYIVIATDRWAIEPAGIDELCARLRGLLAVMDVG